MPDITLRTVGSGDGPVVLLLHGFGAPGDDLVSLADVLDVPAGTRFVFPAAPISLGPAGLWDSRAWWMLDMDAVERAIATGVPRDQSREEPEGLAAARELVLAIIEDLQPPQLILGGFSQGAMLSLDVALRTDIPLAGLILWSGTLLCEHLWAPRMPARAGLPTLIAHGRQDHLLPFHAADRLQGMLASAGLDVDWLPFDGEHTIPPAVVDRTNAFLHKLAPNLSR